MFEEKSRSEIARLGKFGLIKHLSEKFTVSNHSTIGGIGEDASILGLKGARQLISSGLFIEHTHFDLSYFPLRHLGYKCVAVVLSDIVAMNAIPSQVRLTIAVSNRFSIEAVEELMEGVRLCCMRYQVDLAGLDVLSSPTGMVMSVDAIGSVEEKNLRTREGAKEKELICVSGDFGAAYAGLVLLEREKRVFEANPDTQPDLAGYDYLLERQLKPEPRLDIIEALKKEAVLPTSMINVSDGLASALLHLGQASHVGCTVYENKIPIDTLTFNTLKELKIVATTVALNGGEDYELLFTVKQEDYEKIGKIENVSVIGYLQEETAGMNLITNDDKLIQLKAQGFEGDD